jgi:hypothetical protein
LTVAGLVVVLAVLASGLAGVFITGLAGSLTVGFLDFSALVTTGGFTTGFAPLETLLAAAASLASALDLTAGFLGEGLEEDME